MTDVTHNILENIKELIAPKQFQALATLGIPTSKLESWRYSSLASFIPAQAFSEASTILTPEVESVLALYPERLVFSGNKVDTNMSQMPHDFELAKSESDSSEAGNFIQALTTSLAPTAYNLTLASKKTATLAIIHLPLAGSSLSGSQLNLNVLKEAELTLIEIHLGAHESTPTWSNHALEVSVSENATLRHVKLVSHQSVDLSLGRTRALVKAHGTYSHTLVTLGGKLSREEVEIRLEDNGAHGEIRSLAALKDKEQADLAALIYHGAPHTTSAQLVKNILDHKSRGVFTGKIFIEREAIGVDSSQLSKALLLSKLAQMNARPQLEIYADDVKAGHGATIGQLSEEELFYLQSRGLTSAKARQMLCHGFGLEILAEIRDDRTRHFIERLLFQEFEQYTISNLKHEEV